jgi:5-methylcytosine-specific restriction endonuclease McrA
VLRRYPFTIILKEVKPEMLRMKIDPGSKITVIAVVSDAAGTVRWVADLVHRGQRIKELLDRRRNARRSRRNRHTSYRPKRFAHRRRHKGRFPPSLESRIANMVTWLERLRRWCPIGAISVELVKFDLQEVENPDIAGVEYQYGELYGYEVKAYLLEQWGYACAYCGARHVSLEVEHILCRRRGGSNRVSNLTIACEDCNKKKGTQLVEEFLRDRPELLARILAQTKAPLKDAAAVNTTRLALHHHLVKTGLSVETGSGGRTHWLDAVCVGESTPAFLAVHGMVPLVMKATGRHSRQMCRTNRYGFPDKAPKATVWWEGSGRAIWCEQSFQRRAKRLECIQGELRFAQRVPAM